MKDKDEIVLYLASKLSFSFYTYIEMLWFDNIKNYLNIQTHILIILKTSLISSLITIQLL